MDSQLPGDTPRRARQAEQKGSENPVGEGALTAVQECAREVIEGALAALLFAAVAFQARLGVVGAPGPDVVALTPRTLEPKPSPDATDQDARYRHHYYLTPTDGCEVAFKEPSLSELARVIKAGACIEASFKRGKGEVGMDEYQVRTWEGWHHHMALSLMAVWFLIGETHRGQQLTPALTLPQVRYGLSLLLWEVFRTPGVDSICRQVQRQLMRDELARLYHYRTRKCIPPRKLRREIQ